MTIALAELGIQNAIQSAFTLFRQNLATFVPDIFAAETPEHQQEITQWWQNTSNQVPVQIGYQLSPIQGPQCAITVQNAREVASRRSVGNVQQVLAANGNIVFETIFEGTYAIYCFGPNQNWLLWMQTLVRWALLINRQTLESEYGLMNQIISLGPLQPVPDSMHDVVFPFERTVYLTCQTADTWSPLPPELVQSVSLTVNSSTGGD
ncbi:hypothetical protein [Alicyclobacillus sendaiensis]|uniref:hypothetical protein n=1 Tax=Alicyclobacillus sendaiensis TaxID=192387 RepID=UPI0026F42196|nr:hypothetical protein [Alicyclobacillus sendaiensis]